MTIKKEMKDFSQYARKLDKIYSNSEQDLFMITQVEHWANCYLLINCVLCLEKVYALLGLDLDECSTIVGWTKDLEHPDGFVDFSVFECEKYWLIDFNVDGCI